MDQEKHIGHYRVVGELGRGGMGVVYKAYEDELNRHVAIKVLSEQLADHPEVVERFKREAKSMGALNDPHIIQIYLIGEHQGQPFFAMEFVEGESLSQRLKRDGKLSLQESRRILRETAEGLSTAHNRGVIHRDIKPGNLMLDTRGRVRIADFGIAMTHDLGDRLTRTGEFVGTPGYLSPEVCMGKQVDARSDIFALGIVFYEMLTGDLPFTESSPLGMMLEVVKAEIPDIRKVNSDVDDRTYRILTRMIAKDPEDRYQNCADLAEDLAEGPSTQPGLAAGGATVATGGATLASTGGATVAMQTPAPMPSGGQPQAAAPSDPQSLVSTGSRELAVQNKPRSRLPWLATAALALVAMAAGGWTFKDQLLGGDKAARVPTAGLASLSESTAEAPADGEPTDAELEAALRDSLQGQTLARAEPPADGDAQDAGSDASLTAEDPSPTADKVSDGEAAQPREESTGDAAHSEAASPSTRPEVAKLAIGDEPLSTSPTDANPQLVQLEASRSVAQQPEQPEEASSQPATESRPEPAAVEKQPLVVAKATPPPPPAEPRVVVLAVGDPAIAGPVKQMLQNKLQGASLDLLDDAFISGLDRAVGQDRLDLAEASRIISDQGGQYLVLAQIDYLGETPLEYYGQFSTMYSVSLNVKTYDLGQRRTLGPGVREKIDFTSLNAEENAKAALSPHLATIADALRARSR